MLTKRLHKLIVATVIWLPIIMILTVSVFFMHRYYRQLLGQADKLIMNDLARRFNLGVRVGRADFNTLGIAIFEDVEIAAEKTFENGRIFHANKVIIRYSPRKLLFGRGAASISSVDLVEPKLLVIRQKDGRFNIANIFKPAVPPTGPPFEGVVRISNGVLSFKDVISQVNGAPAFIVVRNISGAINASSHPKYIFNAAGTGKAGQLGKVKCNWHI